MRAKLRCYRDDRKEKCRRGYLRQHFDKRVEVYSIQSPPVTSRHKYGMSKFYRITPVLTLHRKASLVAIKKEKPSIVKGTPVQKDKARKPPKERAEFPIVGIGASAGGLEALEKFLSGIPPDAGIAFVVIQHLSAKHKRLMPEILYRLLGSSLSYPRGTRTCPTHLLFTDPASLKILSIISVLKTIFKNLNGSMMIVFPKSMDF